MADVCIRAYQASTKLEFMVAVTGQACRDAQIAHELAPTSAVAFGRLLTCAGMLAAHHRLPGSLSLQVISQSRMKMMYADCTHEGKLRGYVKDPSLAFPLGDAERASGRRQVGPAVAPGKLSMVRIDEDGRYTQSAVPLMTGEIDADIEHFIEQSDQITNLVVCDVLLDDDGAITKAAGVMVQALPDGDRDQLAVLRQRLAAGRFAQLVRDHDDAQSILSVLDADAAPVEAPIPMRWQCRCSYERVRRSLSLFNIADLMELIEADEPVSVRCDMCTKNYMVPVDEVRETLERMIKAQA